MKTEIVHSEETLKRANEIVEQGADNNNPICIYYITLGQSDNSKDVRFVLYRLSLKVTRHENPFSFCQVLGDDLIEAAIKTKSIVGTTPVVIDFNRQNAIAAYTRWTPDVVRFGKNYGLKLSECPEKFVVWVAKGCPLFHEKDQVWCNHYFGGEDFMKIAQEYAIGVGLGKMFNNHFMTNEQFEKATAKKALIDSLVFGHHGEVGKRLTKTLSVAKTAGYDSQFGYVSIITFADDANNAFVYKGTSFPQTVICGDTLTITFGVKHDEYKDQKTTYIQRVKVAQ